MALYKPIIVCHIEETLVSGVALVCASSALTCAILGKMSLLDVDKQPRWLNAVVDEGLILGRSSVS